MLRLKKVNIYILISIILTTLVVVAFFSVKVVAYLTDKDDLNEEAIIGDLGVSIKPYFISDQNVKNYLDLNSLVGVIDINISDYNDPYHINRFGMEIEVNSNIDIYFRVAIYEQFALSYLSGEKETIVATTRSEFAPLKYNEVEFFNNRLVDDYFYFSSRANTNGTTNKLDFITPLGFLENNLYPLYESRYKLMYGIVIEIVQAEKGPEKNWGLSKRPWDNEDW